MKEKLVLYDNHGRPLSYLRLAVTDRCNLRCFYCMPAQGIQYVGRKELLSYEEMERLLRILLPMGISKVRITGGEPFVRKGLMDFLRRVRAMEGIEALNITTNGVLTQAFIPQLKALPISSVNLSLDTLDRQRFARITRRDELPKVLDCLHALIEAGIPTKINAVVMEGQNTEDLVPLAAFTARHPVGVRFIEEMPFNGAGKPASGHRWNHRRILAQLQAAFPDMYKLPDGPHSTSNNYGIPGHLGTVGIIPAFSRTFCGSCNRIRLTPVGMLKTCLYDQGVLDLRAMLRNGSTDELIRNALLRAFSSRAKDGFEAEKGRQAHKPASESMSTIGG
ncbi:MAG: GTP 3',8-cyclase MoaA [Bacteroidetes bacterium]|nr:MAG: GTP 3',8-cyclase MoaA [Bacteroidota bacterium]